MITGRWVFAGQAHSKRGAAPNKPVWRRPLSQSAIEAYEFRQPVFCAPQKKSTSSPQQKSPSNLQVARFLGKPVSGSQINRIGRKYQNCARPTDTIRSPLKR